MLVVVPVLSEHFMPVVVSNSTFFMSIVYVPILTDLRILALEALSYGDDVLDWKRVHAVVRILNITPEIRQCSYVARFVVVNHNLQMIPATYTAATGCLLDLALSAQCHVEIPEKLTNNASLVGLIVSPITGGCRSLSDADDISVEFAPFTRISQ